MSDTPVLTERVNDADSLVVPMSLPTAGIASAAPGGEAVPTRLGRQRTGPEGPGTER